MAQVVAVAVQVSPAGDPVARLGLQHWPCQLSMSGPQCLRVSQKPFPLLLLLLPSFLNLLALAPGEGALVVAAAVAACALLLQQRLLLPA